MASEALSHEEESSQGNDAADHCVNAHAVHAVLCSLCLILPSMSFSVTAQTQHYQAGRGVYGLTCGPH